jgi:DNA-binding Xre family transcriptional regulator
VTDEIDAALDQVGARLRAARTSRSVTLADLSERTGISVSTLSRLETGKRRITLEALVPIARVLGVPLDELVPGPPKDPRVGHAPISRDGMTIVPLSGSAAGVQTFHHTIPAGDPRLPTCAATRAMSGSMCFAGGSASCSVPVN